MGTLDVDHPSKTKGYNKKNHMTSSLYALHLEDSRKCLFLLDSRVRGNDGWAGLLSKVDFENG